ncbi:DUF805 domain-containing protein [Marinicauda salina]|uniref:DUF805 domain-containing protein n=1 Tax=Marinicauda salina TaxID=2135793 RepID=A0A2U2BR76_9PROT|nr:DUF805 domain-containing protein [Marinicauda salina]PWE16517.1 DUF805 domain-containing protein [Marinicauda salina]
MTFVEAVKAVYSNYVGFEGRAERSEFWWFFLFYILAYWLLLLIEAGVLGGPGALPGLFALATLLPALGVSVRRLHDTGKSGWWILLGFIPIVGAIILIIFYVQPSNPGSNQFGESPVGSAGGGAEPA